jgi:uncharacterized membrane protein YfcA
LIPFAVLGALCGAYLTRKMTDVWFYRIVQLSLFLVSIKLVVDAVRG